MEKLRSEIENLEGYGFATSNVTGYGEGVFVVIATMLNYKGNTKVTLSTPQCEEDGIDGQVNFIGHGNALPSHLVSNYRF